MLATDPEAPIDLAALAAMSVAVSASERDGSEWRLTLAAEE